MIYSYRNPALYKLLMLFASLFSCNTKNQTTSMTIDSVSKKTDTIIRDIPKIFKNFSNSNYTLKELKMLNIEDIRNGFDEQQIRIWMNYSFTDSSKVVILKKNNKEWNASIYYLKYKYKYDELDSISKSIEVGSPSSGWDKFIEKITNLGLYNFKNYDNIPNYYLCNDGDGVTIEIAFKSNYRIFSYPCYDLYESKIVEVRNIKKILVLIQNEFKFRIFPRPG